MASGRNEPGGASYEVFILEDATQARTVLKRFSPFASR